MIRMNCGVEKIYNFGSIYAVGLFLVVLCVYCVFGCAETLFEVFSTWVFLFFGRTFLWKRSPWHRRLPYLLNWVDWAQSGCKILHVADDFLQIFATNNVFYFEGEGKIRMGHNLQFSF